MLCAISGEAPQVPVASRKSGNVFEKRLIEACISENGKDPVTGEDLTLEDLVELKSSRTVRPRPPTLTSIPSLLGVFQNEWDALALETFTLRQHLTQTRQELSRALYEHDAAVRVITRLSRERDEAREALSKITINGGAATNGDAMQVDGQRLSEELVATVQSTQERLSKTRRKRAVPEEWATSDTIQSFAPLHKSKPLYTGARTVSIDASGDLALLGGSDGSAGVFSISQNKLVQEFSANSPVMVTLWAGSKAIVGTCAGTVKVFENGTEVSSFSGHAGEVTGLALHASGGILASVGVDKSYILYDLTALTQVLQIYTDSTLTTAQFHPDGHLLAAGGIDGQIRVFETKTGDIAAIFDASGPVRAMSFSENGIWLVSVVQGSTSATVWDLRKAEVAKVLEIGGQIDSVHWDYTGQFLATAGPSGITVQQYSKSAKAWSEPLKSAVPAVDAAWGSKARNLVSLDQGILTVLGSS
ncbi:hypothetical protein ABVK25_006758 [Lepraria finkii]|uniref:Pre-mRNA-processing factor 19 n=1 Tax=Lepraria finkii TaxID=1340010 RepID=A0ABR4B7V2_9LECA